MGLSDLADHAMLGNLWAVLTHSDGMEGDVVLCECCESVPLSPSRLPLAWVTMPGLASASMNHFPFISEPLRFGWLRNADQYLVRGFHTW